MKTKWRDRPPEAGGIIGRAVSGRKTSWKAEQWEQMLCVEERVPRRDAAAIELEDDQCPGRMAPARRRPILPEASCP